MRGIPYPIAAPPNAGGTPDATTSSKGLARLLGGTADAPTVPWASVTGADADVASPADVAAALASGVGAPAVAPSDLGWLGWSLDPALAGSSTGPTAGVLNLVRIKVPTAGIVSGVGLHVATAGATLTNCFVALFDLAGTRLGVSADQSSSWTSGGFKDVLLTAPAAVAAGWVWAAILVGSAGTAPAFARGPSSTVANAGLTAPNLRWATSGSGLTAIPTSVTLGATVALNTGYFAALTIASVSPASLLGINGRGGGAGGWWNLGVGFHAGDPEGSAHVDIDPTTLGNGFSRDPYFAVNSGGTRVKLRVYSDGGTTSGSTHPRSELREYKNATTKASWDGSSGTHVLDGYAAVPALVSNRKVVCVAQVHNTSDDTLQLRCEEITTGSGTYRWVAYVNGVRNTTDLIASYTLGTEVHWRIELTAGVLRLYINGALVITTSPGWGVGQYFKSGDYAQANASDGDTAANYMDVELRSLTVTHSPAL